ncbi:MAG: hypothetical protein M1823_002915 [Watsoniomyces obsoletus]|nr:MAG: hypothetical protein M1823_002915 [Watsoniomyces obsoletus]
MTTTLPTPAGLSPSCSRESSPLSFLASTPPMPASYLPSPPPPSQDSQNTIPPMMLDDSTLTIADDGPPPAKRRRTINRKPRVTQHLDLQRTPTWAARGPGACPADQTAALETLMKVLHGRRKIVVVAGAGISVSAGIPDFRSKTGLFNNTQNQNAVKATGKHLFDASVYKTDAATSMFHDMVRSLSQLAQSAQPTAFHHLLAKLAAEGRLLRLYSQNVDGLEASLEPLATTVPLNTKAPWPRTIQLHGGLDKMVCQKCNHLSDFEPTLFDGPEPPLCRECRELDSVRTTVAGKRSHGIGRLRPRIVLYNEHNPDADAIGSVTRADLKSRPDALIVVGTSLKVRGVRRIVKEMCGVVRGRRDGLTVWINNGAEPTGKDFEDCWDLIVNSESDVVARLAEVSHPDRTATPTGEVVDEATWVAVQERPSPAVVVAASAKKRKWSEDEGSGAAAAAVLTPADTPTPKGERETEEKSTPVAESPIKKIKLNLSPPGPSDLKKEKTRWKLSSPKPPATKRGKATTSVKGKPSEPKKEKGKASTSKVTKSSAKTKAAVAKGARKIDTMMKAGKVTLSAGGDKKPEVKVAKEVVEAVKDITTTVHPKTNTTTGLGTTKKQAPTTLVKKAKATDKTKAKQNAIDWKPTKNSSSNNPPYKKLTMKGKHDDLVGPKGPLPAALAHIMN